MKLCRLLVLVSSLVPLFWAAPASALPPACSTSYCLENPDRLCSVNIHLVMLCCDYIGECSSVAAGGMDAEAQFLATLNPKWVPRASSRTTSTSETDPRSVTPPETVPML